MEQPSATLHASSALGFRLALAPISRLNPSNVLWINPAKTIFHKSTLRGKRCASGCKAPRNNPQNLNIKGHNPKKDRRLRDFEGRLD